MFFAQIYTVKAIDKKTRKEFVFELEAKKKKEIEKSLEKKYIVQDIRRQKTEFEKIFEKINLNPITEEDILKTLQFLAQALQRGVRIKKALEFLLVSEEKKSLQIFIQKMIDRLSEQFSSYYDIFKNFPEYFDHTFLGVVRAGESTGTLPENIMQYIEDRRKMIKQRKDIQKIFIKRGVLFVVVLLIATVIITFVIPQFTKLFEDNPDIPSILLILTAVADFLRYYGLLLFLCLGGGIAVFVFSLKHSYQVKKFVDRFLIRTPLVNDIIRTYYTCQYLYFTGTLLMKNVNYIRIMDILIEQTRHIPFKEVFEIMRENVIKGVPLQEMLKRSEKNLKTHYQKIPRGYLLPSLSQALEMGAATGNMGQILYDAFLSYEVVLHQKIQRGIKIFDKIFYAFIILIMGILFFAMGSAMAALYKNAGSMV